MIKRIIHLVIIGIICIAGSSEAKMIYIDPGAPESGSQWDGVNGSQYNGIPGTGVGYSTLQAGFAAMASGDHVYLRGGRYTENYGSYTAMQFPFNIDGDSWEEGHYQKVASYPGEWAILDASGSGRMCAAGYYGAGSTGGGDYRNPAYWIIERLEITGASGGSNVAGLAIDRGPFKVRFCYIHDNTASSDGENPGGLRGYHWMNSTIEYNFFDNNGSSSGWNSGNVVVFSDYHNTPYNRSTFNINDCRHSNEIRYNYFNNAVVGYKEKGRQFLKSSATDMTHAAKGTKVHHNFFSNHREAIVVDTDFEQVYNNISDGAVLQHTLTRGGVTGENVCMYNVTIYNNTAIEAPIAVGIGYNEDVPDVDLRIKIINNIITSFGTDGLQPSIGLITRQCSGTYCSGISSQTQARYTWTNSEISRNLIHNPQSSNYHIGLPHSVYSSEETRWVTTSEFNNQRNVNNYTNSTSGLFQGTSGPSQYKTDCGFDLGGGKTIANGGGGGNHPYLGFAFPAYVGAVNPEDSLWVDGVLSLSNKSNLSAFSDGQDPNWVEGNSPGGSNCRPIPQNARFNP